ncbi:MAG: chitobiase/beta-hexosaminidase C-terminal domain-containing protein [Terracidiphilus sp.]
MATLSRQHIPAQSNSQTKQDPSFQKARLAADYGNLPLSFEANAGQTDARVKFFSRGSGYGLYLTSDEAVLALNGHPCTAGASALASQTGKKSDEAGCANDSAVVTMRLARRANGSSSPAGEESLPGTANYFVGSDPAAWRSGVPTYAKVRYSNVYPGVDLLYYGNQRQLEYDFWVAPHADPKAIRLQFSGVTKLKLDSDGDLIVSAKNGDIAFRRPVIYQERDGHRNLIAGRFTLGRRHTVTFALNDYDHSRPLIIDPVLAYSTYLGGSGDNGDAAFAIAVDSAGDAYVTGMTDSVNFPLTSGSYQESNKGAANSTFNAFVTKLNATGTALVYSTYLGGSANTQALALAVDGSGSAYVTGTTSATDFPTTSGAYQTASLANATGYTAFVTKLNATGTALVYSTYLGGGGNGSGTGDSGNALAVDSSGNVYVAGSTSSANFPATSGAYQTVNKDQANNQQSAFVTKLNASGSALIYSSFLGGSAGDGQSDVANAMAVDGSGDVYLTGQAGSSDFPITAGAYQTTNTASAHSTTVAFVSELNPSGTGLLYSTFLGGSEGAAGSALAINASGDAYVTGYAKYTDFPVTAGAFQSTNNGTALNVSNAFVAKLNPTGSALLYSTYLGGSGLEISAFNKDGDSASGLAIDASGDAYVTGIAFSSNFPVTSGAYQTTNNGSANKTYNAFVTELNPTGAALLYSTFIGGSGFPFGSTSYYRGDDAMGLAMDATDNIYIAGIAFSADYPVTKGPFQSTNRAVGNSGSNAFVSKLSLAGQVPSPIATTATLTPSATPITVGASVTFTAGVTAASGSSVPAGSVVFTVDGSTAATVTLSSGTASYSNASLAAGSHTVSASYEGSAAFSPSIANATENVNPPEQPASAPAFSPAVGAYASAQSVTLSDATAGAKIYYTTNGTTPTASSTQYTSAIPVSASETIEAIAVASGYSNSVVAAGSYTITPTVATPTFPVAIETYTSAQSVTIAEATSGAAIYYTTDTTTPTTSSTKYTAAIPLSATTTVKAIAVASGYNNSAVASATYTITPPAATPLISLAAGTYTSIQSVTLTDTAKGATIYYTINGTAPTTASTKYTGAITVSSTETIEAIAAAPGYVASLTAVAKYTINLPLAKLQTPTPGSVLTGSSVTFTWTAGSGVTSYDLWLGTSGPGSNSLYNSGQTTVTSATVTNLPAKGATIYVRLFSVISGTTQYIDYTYTEAGTPATMTSPTPGGTPGTSNVTFTWTTGAGVSQYNLWLGLSGPGSSSLYASGWSASTSATVPSLPAKGATIYARLYSDVNGVVQYNDYTYIEQ